MTVSPTEAAATAAALRAGSADPEMLRQVRYELAARADEWDRAVIECMEHDGEAVIELAMSVSRGMRLYHDRFGWCRVLRRLNDGMSLHLETVDSPQGWYRNQMDPTSPVVVKL